MKKTDRRISRTRQLLLDSLIGLILEKGYEAISVTDITERANVGRSTFYAHFENKEQLLFSGHDGLTQSLLFHTQSPQRQDRADFFQQLFQHVADNKQLATAMIGKGGGDLMLGRMREVLIDFFLIQIRQKRLDEQKSQLYAASFASAIIGFLAHWLENDLDFSVMTMSEQADQIMNAMLTLAE